MRFRAVVALVVAVLLLLGASVWSTVGATEAADDSARPPAWGHQDRSERGPDDAWKKTSPAQKADTMKRLTREHARGMRAWGECQAAGRDDCVRPTPPGHAKRR
jgi:cytochrome c-type biogenesis protein CcmH/NrfG